MAQAARAYAYPERSREVERPARPRVKVVPGASPRTSVETVSSAVLVAAKVIACVLVFVTALGFVRIGLAAATVTTSLSTQEISADLTTARSAAATLEVQESTLGNPTRIKDVASELNMAAPAEVSVLSLPVDVVATDAAGNLSLTESMRLASSIAS